MRFLMLNWRDPRNPLAGGAERVTLGYLAGLAQRGHEVFWFTHEFAEASREDLIDGVKIYRRGGIGRSIVHAWRWCRRQKPFDLVIDQHHGIPWFAPWWCRTNCVAYLHEVLGPIWNSFYPWPLSATGRWQERWTHWLYRKTPFWTASVATKEILHSRGVREVTVIPYGVQTMALSSLDPKSLSPPLKLAVVSRLAPNKRIDHCVQVLHCLRTLGVEADLMIVGAGTEEQKLKQLIAHLKLEAHVVFTGPLSENEKDDLLRRAHFLLHTSQREGWGLNVIEANAMGTPGAVYPVAGLLESTIPDETGIVAQQETPESLAARLMQALKRPEDYQRWRRNAWKRAQSYHWDHVLPKACEWLEGQARQRLAAPAEFSR